VGPPPPHSGPRAPSHAARSDCGPGLPAALALMPLAAHALSRAGPRHARVPPPCTPQSTPGARRQSLGRCPHSMLSASAYGGLLLKVVKLFYSTLSRPTKIGGTAIRDSWVARPGRRRARGHQTPGRALGVLDVTTRATLRSRRTQAASFYHVRVSDDGDSPTSRTKDTRIYPTNMIPVL
jgi:hypothetical protein